MKLRETWVERHVFRAGVAPVPASKVLWRLYCTVVPNVCVSSVWVLFRVTFGARNFDMAYVFFTKFVHPCCRVCVGVFEP